MPPSSTRPPRTAGSGPADAEVVLVVRVAGRRLGLLAGDVLEVQRMVALEPLPDPPAAVEGLIDLRGRVVAVLALGERLGLQTRPPRASDHLVIARSGTRLVAVRVDEALSLEAVPRRAFASAQDMGPRTPRLRGVARLPDALLVIADLRAFLGWEEAAALDDALARRGGAGGG